MSPESPTRTASFQRMGTRVPLLFTLGAFVVLAASGCGDNQVDSPNAGRLPAQQLPAALTSHVPPSEAELTKLRDVPSDVRPDSNDISRVRLPSTTFSKYFIGHWDGPPDNPGHFFCVYRIDPGQPGAAADCFGVDDYAAGVPTITSSRNNDGYELVGFTPDPNAEVTMKLPGRSKRLVVSQNAFGLSTREAPESVSITALGKRSEIGLN